MAIEKKIKGIQVWESVWKLPVKDDPDIIEKYEILQDKYGAKVNKAIEEKNRKIREAEEKFKDFVITY